MSTLTKRDQAEAAMRRSWFPVARSVDLGSPVAATLLDERLVVWRGQDGAPKVTAARCPHRGGDLAMGETHGNDIGCPYHGWRFSGDTGACTYVPSLPDQAKVPRRAHIKTYPAVERFGHVWTVLDDPIVDMYDPEEWHGVEMEWLAGEPIDSPTGVAVAVENFRDVAHFPFVHKVSMGETPEIVEPLEVRRAGLDVYMDRALSASDGEWAEQGDCMMHYHCIAPGFSIITFDYEVLGKRMLGGFPSPKSYDSVRIFWGVANEPSFRGEDLEECRRLEAIVYSEDVPIVERLEPREVPWDGEYDEYSVPSDLFTMNYRRAFGELMSRVSQPESPPVPA
jgi:phenylpropionate dioxygenase-like ring-hydroxylating dioxygenase large terminal subunit